MGFYKSQIKLVALFVIRGKKNVTRSYDSVSSILVISR